MPGIELKTVNPVVFDDPDYCNRYSDKCEWLNLINKSNPSCDLFPVGVGAKILLHWEYTRDENLNKKCQECKEHYTKNKPIEEEKESCKFCGDEIKKGNIKVFIDGLGRYYCSENCFKDHQASKGF